MGIPRANRLRRSKDFARVRDSGQSWVNRWLVLIALKNDLDQVRVGAVASRRVGSAVTRARTRRLIREAVRPRLEDISGGWDLVFLARASMGSASFHDVDRAVAELLTRASLLLENEQ